MDKESVTNENEETLETKSNPQLVDLTDVELGEEELDAVSGGIIFVGGHNNATQTSKSSISHSDWQTLNPQPIPPGKNQ